MEVNATEAARQIKDSAHEKVQTKAKAAEAEPEPETASLATEAAAENARLEAGGGGGGGGKPREPGSHIAKWNATAEWEPAKARTRLAKWANAVRVSTTTHGDLATTYRRWERGLSLVLVTINAIIGGSIFTSISDSPLTIYLQVFAGVLSMLAAVLAAWKSELKWAERSEAHRNAARGFEKISHRFVRQLDMMQVCPLDEEGKLLKAWNEIIQAWEDLESESPQIPPHVYEKSNAKTLDQDNKFPGQN